MANETIAPNARYWQETNGAAYQEMIRAREAHSSRAYSQQEQFLTDLVTRERERLGRDLEVLEFGCGFGRHASYLAGLPGIRYHGYDFSEPMTAPLRENPPRGMEDVAERLLVGPDVVPLVGERRFDLVFTVSVFIHNAPERLPGLFESLASLLRPNGTLCLVENQLVPFDVYENNWHNGCWLHPYPELAHAGWDVYVGQGRVDTHDLYVFRRNGIDERRLFRFDTLPDPEHGATRISDAELAQMSLRKIRTWAGQASLALRNDAGGQETKVVELQERIETERLIFKRRVALASVADDLARMRNQLRPGVPAHPPTHQQAVAEPVLLNDAQDTRWAMLDARFNRVLHVFHQEWHGIRAAAAYLPGQKLAISANHRLSAEEMKRALEVCCNGLTRSVVLHSASENTLELLGLLRRTMGSDLRLSVVWHGSTAQFHYEVERKLFTQLLELRRKGGIDALAMVKPGMHRISPLLHPKTLINVPPSGVQPAGERPMTGGAFLPVPNDWRKNYFTNVYGAGQVQRIRDLYVTTKFDFVPEVSLHARVVFVPRPSRTELLDLLDHVDVVLNATLSECQPMTALEALAKRIPCLTGPLALGSPFDEHPLQKLCQIPAVDSVELIAAAIERVLDLRERDQRGLVEMMDDYERLLRAEAVARFNELVQP